MLWIFGFSPLNDVSVRHCPSVFSSRARASPPLRWAPLGQGFMRLWLASRREEQVSAPRLLSRRAERVQLIPVRGRRESCLPHHFVCYLCIPEGCDRLSPPLSASPGPFHLRGHPCGFSDPRPTVYWPHYARSKKSCRYKYIYTFTNTCRSHINIYMHMRIHVHTPMNTHTHRHIHKRRHRLDIDIAIDIGIHIDQHINTDIDIRHKT